MQNGYTINAVVTEMTEQNVCGLYVGCKIYVGFKTQTTICDCGPCASPC